MVLLAHLDQGIAHEADSRPIVGCAAKALISAVFAVPLTHFHRISIMVIDAVLLPGTPSNSPPPGYGGYGGYGYGGYGPYGSAPPSYGGYGGY